MCVVSMIGDHYGDKFKQLPIWQPSESAAPSTYPFVIAKPAEVSREEFDALRRDVAEMKELLRRAKDYDERNGEPDCEVDEKMDLLRKVADLVGVNIDEVIGAAR